MPSINHYDTYLHDHECYIQHSVFEVTLEQEAGLIKELEKFMTLIMGIILVKLFGEDILRLH